MRTKIIGCLIGFSICGLAFALPDKSELDGLSRSVKVLRQEVVDLKAELKESKHAAHSHHAHQNESYNNKTASLNTPWLPMDFTVPGRSFVSSGPYIGVPISYSGGHLIVNSPSVNQDFALLKLRHAIRDRFAELGVTESPDSAHLLLSGLVEGGGVFQTSGTGSTSSAINLNAAGIDAYILGPGQWLSALIALSYDGSTGASEGVFANNDPTQNSRVFVNQAFITVGHLSTTPFYGTVGQLFVPFGTYSSNMISSPLTKSLARTKARPLVIGYHPLNENNFYSAGYLFSGPSHSGSASRINNGGINVGWHFMSGSGFGGDLGAGVIANIADSNGMQNVGNSAGQFNGFGGTNGTGNEQITHRVPAIDVRANLSTAMNINLLAEYISTTSAFNRNDLTQNSHGARPRALNAEAAYTFTPHAHPCSVAVGYGMTKDAMALGLPAQRFSMAFNTSIWPDTIQSFEFKHEIAYAAGETATGSGVSAPHQSGRSDNVISAQFDLYF